MKGEELAEDLRVFIWKLSGQIAEAVEEQGEKVYTVEDLAKSLDVSTKTIDRWRKRGLPARKFTFGDGKKRLGILQSAVDKFLDKDREPAESAKKFNRLSHAEKQAIIRRASRLASKGRKSRHQIIEQIAMETGRAHETVRYTILNYEKRRPDKPIFDKAAGVIDPTQAQELYILFQQGCGVDELMRRFDRSKSSIYRIINQRRAKVLLARKIEFIASDEFLEDGAKEKILGEPFKWKPTTSTEESSLVEERSESMLSEYLQTIRNSPVLDREQETELFRRYNYLKYLACIQRAGMHPAQVPSSRVREIEGYLDEAEKIKQLLIESNLRLVVNVAMKHMGGGANLSDLVSEGNVSLMAAVESFDYRRGVRFAAHASWAIAKDYAHRMPGETSRAGKPGAAWLADVHRELAGKGSGDVVAVERARQSLTEVIKENLDEREQYVILYHFGLIGMTVKKKKKTLMQIGDDLGLTKERVRQIELLALQKLRQRLSPEQFELLTG
jgi:RNA polymerase sigma factor (sigma-70 family)